MRAFDITMIRSDTASASSWSCVTYATVRPSESCSSRISSRTRRRSFASRFESGSSNSSTCRFEHERPRDRDPLLLPARQLGRRALLQPGQSDQRQLLGGHLAGALLRDALHRRAIRDIVQHAHMREKRVGLEHHRDVAVGGGELRHVALADADPAARRHLQPGDHAQRGGLAAPGGAEQRDELAGRDLERHVVDRGDRPVALHHALEAHGRARLGGRGRAHAGCTEPDRACRRPRRRSPTSLSNTTMTTSMSAISAEEYAIATPYSPASTRPMM